MTLQSGANDRTPGAALVSSLFTVGYTNCHCWMKRTCNYAFKLMSLKGVVCFCELIFFKAFQFSNYLAQQMEFFLIPLD